MNIVDVTKDEKYIIKLYRFFDSLGNSIMPNKKRFMFYCKIGKAYAIIKNEKVVGGLIMYPEEKYNVLLNCYIPEESRKSLGFFRMIELFTAWTSTQKKKVRTFFRSEDIGDFKRMAKPIEGHENYYELLIPHGLDR